MGISAGAKRFGVPAFTMAVISDTGTEVDEDEILLIFPSQTTLMLLTDEDKWTFLTEEQVTSMI